MNVSLPDALKAWVEEQTTSGAYGNASEYVRDLIRKDKQRLEALHALQVAITLGAESGEPEPLDPAAFKLRMRERHVLE